MDGIWDDLGNTASPQLWSLGLRRVYVCSTESWEREASTQREREREKEGESKKRGMKNSLICFSTVEAPTLSSSRMQSLFCRSVCVCACVRVCVRVCMHCEGGWGPHKCMLSRGREPVPLLPLPSQSGILLAAPLPSPEAPAPFLSPLFLSFQGEFILSLAHCGEWRDWLAKGWPGVPWLTLPGQPCWS